MQSIETVMAECNSVLQESKNFRKSDYKPSENIKMDGDGNFQGMAALNADAVEDNFFSKTESEMKEALLSLNLRAENEQLYNMVHGKPQPDGAAAESLKESKPAFHPNQKESKTQEEVEAAGSAKEVVANHYVGNGAQFSPHR